MTLQTRSDRHTDSTMGVSSCMRWTDTFGRENLGFKAFAFYLKPYISVQDKGSAAHHFRVLSKTFKEENISYLKFTFLSCGKRFTVQRHKILIVTGQVVSLFPSDHHQNDLDKNILSKGI